MMIYLYKFISNVLVPLVIIFFCIRLILGKETITSFFEKFSLYFEKKPKKTNKTIWINAVSIGEAKVGITISEILRKKDISLNIILSTSTITSYKLLKELNSNLKIIFAPLDLSFAVKRFLKKWNPKTAIFIESEIWPNTFEILKKNKIKLQIVNARLSERSYLNWMKISFFSKKLFELIDRCYVQDQSSLERFASLGAKKIIKIPNLKFLNGKPLIKIKDYKLMQNPLKKKFVVTLFSSHENEEELMIECFLNLKKKIKNLFVVLIPRHVQRSKRIVQLLEKNNIKFLLRSSGDYLSSGEDIILVDKFGELPLFFKLSQIVIVGGSFVKKGGQNPIEVSFYKCPIIFGPHMFNFSEIAKKMEENLAGFKVKNKNELQKKILFLYKNNHICVRTAKNFSKFCSDEKRKSYDAINEIFELRNG